MRFQMNDGPIASPPIDSLAAMRRVFDLQRAASRREAKPTLAERLDALARLRSLALDNRRDIAAAISADFGTRSPHETELLEVTPLLNSIRYARRHLARWMKTRRKSVDIAFQPARAYVRYEPLGVVGIIAPWNYPLQLTLSPLVDALAAGNRAMVKPSELTPRFAALLQRLVAERFEEAQVAVATGDAAVAEGFAALPFDHLLFTGSTAIGRKVMAAAAQNLTPVTLELGGKSPAIVCPDYPLEKAARSIAFGKFLNAGQTCIAPDYALVPADRVDAFAEAVLKQVRKSYPTIGANADYTSVISEGHVARLLRAVKEAEEEGARVLTHGRDLSITRKISPTLVLNAAPASTLMNEEIFGPVLPIVPYDDLSKAIEFVNAKDRPLALYCFSNDEAMRQRVLDGATSGGVTLNGALLHFAQDSLPFGGIGPSGMGAYHGEDGFRRFSHARAVHQVGAINVLERLGPPWGKLASLVARLLSKR
jgi:coniferyl-aldehyde dehydrogenase